MSHDLVIKRLFEFFYRKLYGSGFTLNLDQNQHRKQIANFIDLVVQYFTMESVGAEFLLQYFSFQFGYWHDKAVKRKLTLNWIIGPKAFKRWFERKDGHDYYVERFLHELNLNLDEIRGSLRPREVGDALLVHASEELEKSRFPDTEARLYHCLQSTTMFNHRSPICISCHQRRSCKTLLGKLSLVVFQKRGYDVGAES